MAATEVPRLTDGRVTLRGHTADDVPAIVEMCRDPAMVRWTSIPDPYAVSDAHYFIDEIAAAGWAKGTNRVWAIELDGAYAGNLDVRGSGVADVGFALHPAARGTGVMTTAVRLAVGWAFETGAADAVTWRSHVGNTASLRVAWSCGFRLLGHVPAALHERGRLLDAWSAVVRKGDDLTTPRRPWLEPTPLRGAGVRLRPMVDGDLPRVVEACADPATQFWLTRMPDPYGPDDAREYLDASRWQEAVGERVSWAVTSDADDLLLARLSIFGLGGRDPSSGELGYWTHPEARNRGLTKAAVAAVVRHAFTSPEQGGLGLRRLTLEASAGNEPSRRIAVGAGFTQVGVLRAEDARRDGTYDDLVVYDLLADEARPYSTSPVGFQTASDPSSPTR